MATLTAALQKFMLHDIVNFVVIGNSVGCGFYGANSATIAGISLSNGKLTPSGRTSDAPSGAWVTRFRAYVKARNETSQVYNYSGNGWDTNDHRGISLPSSGIIGPTDTVAEIAALSQKPDLAILALQINDPNHGLALGTFETNTRAIIAGLAATDVPTLLMLENYADITNYGLFQSKLAEIGADLGIPIIDGRAPFGATGAGYMNDYAHPTDPGHALLFQAVAGWFNANLPAGGQALAAGITEARGIYSSAGALRNKLEGGEVVGFPMRPGDLDDPIRVYTSEGVYGVRFE